MHVHTRAKQAAVWLHQIPTAWDSQIFDIHSLIYIIDSVLFYKVQMVPPPRVPAQAAGVRLLFKEKREAPAVMNELQ